MDGSNTHRATRLRAVVVRLLCMLLLPICLVVTVAAPPASADVLANGPTVTATTGNMFWTDRAGMGISCSLTGYLRTHDGNLNSVRARIRCSWGVMMDGPEQMHVTAEGSGDNCALDADAALVIDGRASDNDTTLTVTLDATKPLDPSCVISTGSIQLGGQTTFYTDPEFSATFDWPLGPVPTVSEAPSGAFECTHLAASTGAAVAGMYYWSPRFEGFEWVHEVADASQGTYRHYWQAVTTIHYRRKGTWNPTTQTGSVGSTAQIGVGLYITPHAGVGSFPNAVRWLANSTVLNADETPYQLAASTVRLVDAGYAPPVAEADYSEAGRTVTITRRISDVSAVINTNPTYGDGMEKTPPGTPYGYSMYAGEGSTQAPNLKVPTVTPPEYRAGASFPGSTTTPASDTAVCTAYFGRDLLPHISGPRADPVGPIKGAGNAPVVEPPVIDAPAPEPEEDAGECAGFSLTDPSSWAGAGICQLVRLFSALLDGVGKMLGVLRSILGAFGALADAIAGIPRAIGDLLETLFVPDRDALADRLDGIGGDSPELEAWTGTLGIVFGGDGGGGSSARLSADAQTSSATAANVPQIPPPPIPVTVGSPSCKGIGVTWSELKSMGLGSSTIYPFEACAGTLAQVASLARMMLMGFIGISTAVKILQMLAVSVGAARNINAMTFDWSDATVRSS